MAAAALQPETRRFEPDPLLDDNDEEDAEGEDDPMIDVQPLHAENDTPAPGDDASDLDAEGEEVEEEQEDGAGQDAEGDEVDEDEDEEVDDDDDEAVEDDGEAVGPVKLPGKTASSVSDDEEDGDTGRSADDASSADEGEDASDKASSSASESDAEAEWEEASNRGGAEEEEEEEEAEIANPNRCMSVPHSPQLGICSR